jgi:hypothetical protein
MDQDTVVIKFGDTGVATITQHDQLSPQTLARNFAWDSSDTLACEISEVVSELEMQD